MRDSNSGRPASDGSRQKDEERAQRLWAASAHRAAVSVQHKRHLAAEIYWRSAFDIALVHLQRKIPAKNQPAGSEAGDSLFTPAHLLESLQGLVNVLIEQGKSKAARSLFNEVVELLLRSNLPVTGLAERTLNMIAQRIAQVQRETASVAHNNVEDLPLPIAGKNRAAGVRSASVS